MINAYNLVDGVDGLAGSLALIGLSAVVFIGGIGASSTHVALMLSVAIVGFLIFNFPMNGKRPLRTFMGDAGSTFLGFAIVWVALSVSQGSERLVSPVYCLWFAAIPIFDCLTCVVRRSLAGKSPLTSSRDHFHDKLFRGGMGVRQVLAVLAGLQLLYAAAAVAAHYSSAIPDVAMFATWSVLGLTQRQVIKKVAELYKHRSSQRKHRALAT
jgi:UDP-GlcNAc:undecaprenyl-phosphate GlcNAc-1-phosphate transferase